MMSSINGERGARVPMRTSVYCLAKRRVRPIGIKSAVHTRGISDGIGCINKERNPCQRTVISS